LDASCTTSFARKRAADLPLCITAVMEEVKVSGDVMPLSGGNILEDGLIELLLKVHSRTYSIV